MARKFCSSKTKQPDSQLAVSPAAPGKQPSECLDDISPTRPRLNRSPAPTRRMELFPRALCGRSAFLSTRESKATLPAVCRPSISRKARAHRKQVRQCKKCDGADSLDRHNGSRPAASAKRKSPSAHFLARKSRRLIRLESDATRKRRRPTTRPEFSAGQESTRRGARCRDEVKCLSNDIPPDSGPRASARFARSCRRAESIERAHQGTTRFGASRRERLANNFG